MQWGNFLNLKILFSYYRKAFGILLLFDVTKRSSFNVCSNYLEDVKRNSDKDCVIYLIGNKIDLIDKREVKRNEAENFARKEGIKYIETSAVENKNVSDAFTNLLHGNFYLFFIFFLDIYHVRKRNEEICEDIDKEEKKGNTSTMLKNDNNKQIDNEFGFCCP